MRSRAREASCSGKGVFRGYILLHGNEHVFRDRAGQGRYDNRKKNAMLQYLGSCWTGRATTFCKAATLLETLGSI